MILSDALAELLFRGGNIQNIVNDLKGQTQGLAETCEVAKFSGMDTDRHGAQAKGCGDEGACLGAVDFDQFFERDSFFFRLKIENLPCDQAEAAGSLGEFGDEIGGGVAAVGFGASNGGEGLGQKAVPREDSDGFPEDAVVCGATPAEMIVVHAGEIVMDEGVGVNALDGAGGGKCQGLRAASGPGSGEA